MHRIKYFITGGGTGGHIYPALALVRTLIKEGVQKDDIFYIGNKNNLEYKIAKDEGLNFLHYDVCGMPRKISPKLFLFFIKLITALFFAFHYALKYKPDVVFATGGYVCAPILFVANFLKIPYVLHDCDAHPGIVSRLFSKNAYAQSFAFESALEYSKCKNSYCLGNPIRDEFKTLNKDEAKRALNIDKNFVILIMGGSSGAKKINDCAVSIVQKYKDNKDVQIIWQSGKKNYEDVKNAVIENFSNIPQNLILRPYFDNMAQVLMASDVAISRAGSLSLSELCAAGLPCVLVPYPYAAANHQRINAEKMCETGAAIYLDDNDCTKESLLGALEEYILNPQKLKAAAKCAKDNAKYNAASEIAKLINEAAQKGKRG